MVSAYLHRHYKIVVLMQKKRLKASLWQLYEPGTNLVDVGELRWTLFTEKQLEAKRLPPTQGALHQEIARAHYPAMVWHQDQVPNPEMPPATEYGWEAEGDQLVPVTTWDPPAPVTITQLWLKEIPVHVTLFLSISELELFWDVHGWGRWRGVF